MARGNNDKAAGIMKSLGLDPSNPEHRQAYNEALSDLADDGYLIEDPDGSGYIVGN